MLCFCEDSYLLNLDKPAEEVAPRSPREKMKKRTSETGDDLTGSSDKIKKKKSSSKKDKTSDSSGSTSASSTAKKKTTTLERTSTEKVAATEKTEAETDGDKRKVKRVNSNELKEAIDKRDQKPKEPAKPEGANLN